MDFDIHQLDRMAPDSEGTEAAFEAFQQALLERFAQSPEGQERFKADPDMGFWAAQLMYYGYQYEGKAVPRMTVGDVQTVVTELFPRKISLHSPEQADDAIPELLAFWKYLKREFHLPQSDAVLEFLREVEPDFPGMMNDPSNFGMAKSFFTMGQAAGFDMTTQEGMNAFMLAFNARPARPAVAAAASLPNLPAVSAAVRSPGPGREEGREEEAQADRGSKKEKPQATEVSRPQRRWRQGPAGTQGCFNAPSGQRSPGTSDCPLVIARPIASAADAQDVATSGSSSFASVKRLTQEPSGRCRGQQFAGERLGPGDRPVAGVEPLAGPRRERRARRPTSSNTTWRPGAPPDRPQTRRHCRPGCGPPRSCA